MSVATHDFCMRHTLSYKRRRHKALYLKTEKALKAGRAGDVTPAMRLYDDYSLDPQAPKGIITISSYAPAHESATVTFDDATTATLSGLAALNRAWHTSIVTLNHERTRVVDVNDVHKIKKIPGYINLHDKQKYGVNKRGLPIYLWHPLSPRYPPMYVASSAAKSASAIYVLATPLEWTITQKYPRGTCDEVLGPCGDVDADHFAAAHHRALFDGHAPLSRAEANALECFPHPESRRTITDTVFSIDPPGCVDIDDAVHVTCIDANANAYEVGIHIADVTAFIPMGSAVDTEASRRSQTIYLPKKQVPIIPEVLAHDRCSLLPGQPRPAVSCIVTFNSSTPIIHTFERTMIRSRAALTYEEADNTAAIDPAIASSIQTLHRLMGTQGDDSHKLVERLMILANTYAAQRLLSSPNTPALVRRQRPNAAAEYVVASQQASAANGELAHTTLGLDAYTHFTSPIRRYADQIVHRLLMPPASLQAPLTEAVVAHLNLQNKRHRRFQRDTNMLKCVHSHSPFTTNATIAPLRYSPKYGAFKIDLEIDVSQLNIGINTITFPWKAITRAMSHIVKVEQTADTVTLNDSHTGTHQTLMVGDTLPLTLYFRPTEPRLQNKVAITLSEYQGLAD